MLTPKLVVTMISPETGRPRPIELDVLPEPLTAAEHGLMVGNPPPDDKLVHHGNWTAWPNIRWSFTHKDELRASGRISRGPGPAEPLPVAAPAETGIDLDDLTKLSLEELLDSEATTVSHKAESLSAAPAAV